MTKEQLRAHARIKELLDEMRKEAIEELEQSVEKRKAEED